MLESNDLLQILVGLLSLGVFFVGFASVRLQASFGRIEARLEEQQDRLAEEAKRDDSFPLPWDLERLRAAAFEKRIVDRLLTVTTLVVVSVLNAMVVLAAAVYGIAPSDRPIPLAISVGAVCVAVVVQLVALLEFNLSSRLPRYAVNRSPLGAWHSVARNMDARHFAQARKDAQRLLDRMPSWPWADVVLAVATARLNGPQVVYASDFDLGSLPGGTGRSRSSEEREPSERGAVEGDPEASGTLGWLGEAYQPVAQLISRLDVIERLKSAGWSELDDPIRGRSGHFADADRTSVEDWILIREVLATYDLILRISAGRAPYWLVVEAIDEHLETRVLNTGSEQALVQFAWWRTGEPPEELRSKRSASAERMVISSTLPDTDSKLGGPKPVSDRAERAES